MGLREGFTRDFKKYFAVLWCLLLQVKHGTSTITQDFIIEENRPPGTFVGKLTGQAPFMIFDNSQGIVAIDLDIDANTGRIVTKVELDREKRDVYSFGAVSASGGNEPLSISIRVSDVNDNSPQFPRSSMRLNMSESAPKDTKESLGYATDPDLGLNSTQSYEITSGNADNAFRLSGRLTGSILYCDLLVNGALDYESTKQFTLVVTAYDGGNPRRSGSLQIIVDILDANDNQPIFNTSRYSSRVSENAAIGVSIVQVFATDVDSQENGRIKYYIDRTRSDTEQVFGIDSQTGVITLNKKLDYETKTAYELIVVARDSGIQPLETTAVVSVYVQDVNDNQPIIDLIFLTDDGSPRLPESAEPGDYLARISVSDKDGEGLSPLVNVTLVGGEGHFALTSRDNIVYLVIVTNPVDREMRPFYQLTVVAKDNGSPPLSSNRTFTVQVLDTNDNRPVFNKRVYETTVQEVSPPGSSVLQVVATDLDVGNNSLISYSIVYMPLNHSDWFQIDADSGLITTRTSLDCETESQPEFTVSATDHGNPPLATNVSVVVTIRDENDNQPVFDHSFYTVSVPEDRPSGKCLLTVNAVDLDCGVNAKVTYAMAGNLSQNAASEFEVRADTGLICIRAPLDYETRSLYEFSVVAMDGDGLQSTTIVKILVTDINDNLPVFYPDQYDINLVPNTVPGTEVAAVQATDADADGRITYRIANGNLWNLFAINENTGVVRLVSSLPANVVQFTLSVQASDSGGFLAHNMAQVLVSVIAPSQAPPVFTRSVYAFVIYENASVSSAVGTVHADNTDTSLTAVAYSITAGDRSGYLAVDSVTGLIRVARQLDREAAPILLLNIQAASGNPPRFGKAQVNVTVADVNDNRPTFSASRVDLIVKEDVRTDAVIYLANAVDRDEGVNGQVRYGLVTNPDNTFFLDPITGLLKVKKPLDYELRSQYTLTVQAIDGGTPPLVSTMQVNILVEDMNDNAPVFRQVSYRLSVSELAVVSYKFGQVSASDADSGNNAKLTYGLEPLSAQFAIFPNDGTLYVKKKLDREIQSLYRFSVTARDNGSPAKTSQVALVVEVLDENDHSPVFQQADYQFHIDENLQPDHVVGVVSATDADAGTNADLVYSLSTASNEFAVSSLGRVRTLVMLDREAQDRYTLVVLATDSGAPALSALVNVRILVDDVNDNSPTFQQVAGTATVDENSARGTKVIQVSARDLDIGVNGNVTYSLSASADSALFTIDPVTGWIATDSSLDYEIKSTYQLVVVARDCGVPSRQATQSFVVSVKDVVEGSPEFPTEQMSLYVAEDVSIGSVIGQATTRATDGQVAYYTLYGNELANFEVDMDSGQIYVARPLDYELKSSYTLVIRATNSNALFGRSTTIYINIILIDINDNSPSFNEDPIVITVDENLALGAILYEFIAQDADTGSNGTVRYRITQATPVGDYLHLDPSSGIMKTKAVLDYEMIRQLSVVVEATDQGPVETRRTAMVTAFITVRDLNDNWPIFKSAADVVVWEDTPIGYPLIYIIADDLDSEEAGRVTYTILEGNDNEQFLLDPNNGLLTLAKQFDLEAISVHVLNVTAQDRGSPHLVSWQRLTVRVQAVNDHPPVFDRAYYSGQVTENTPPGQSLVTITATYRDRPPGSMTYSLPAGASEGKFTVDRNSGLIRTTAALDREQQDTYNITAYAGDSMTSQLVAVTVVITVLDVNDNNPSFAASRYSITIRENQAYVRFYTVTASDPDLGQNGQIKYYITDGNVDNKFTIEPSSGQLSCEALDAEKTSRYDLTITAQDMSTIHPLNSTMSTIHPLNSTMTLVVLVADQNDNNPTFSQKDYQVSVPEDVALDTSVITVSAVDADKGNNGKVLLSLGPGTNGAFKINPDTGLILTTGYFDREKLSEYRFDVLATDGGTDTPRTVRVPVTVQIRDINDNYPVFTSIPYQAAIQLNLAAGASIVQVRTTDADIGDNSLADYSLISPSAYFTMEAGSGIIRTKRVLDDAAVGYHDVVVQAQDKGTPRLTSQGLVKIKVGNPVGVSDIEFIRSVYNVSLNENSPRDTPIVQVQARYTASSISAGITYTIVGSDVNTYIVDRNTGWVKVGDPRGVDYERAAVTGVVVVAEGGGASTYTHVWILLVDRNDNPPVFTQQRYVSAVLEDLSRDTMVTEVTATDLDMAKNGDIRYSIIGGNRDNSFRLESDRSGVIKTNSILDREIVNVYTLEIEAADQGDVQLSSTCTVLISVLDVNDNAPFFPLPQPIVVLESTKVGNILQQVTANDVDASGQLIYGFRPDGNPGDVFGLDIFSGRISLVRSLDYETQSNYTLQLVVSDGLNEAYTNLTVLVKDVNDNRPKFSQDRYEVTVVSTATVGQSVLTVTATDADSGDNARLTYSIYSSTHNGVLIEPDSGRLVINSTMAPTDVAISLLIEASDHGQPALTSLVDVRILVTSAAGQPPVFDRAIYKVSVSEGSPSGTVVLTVVANTGQESSNQSKLDYHISGGNTDSKFSITTTSGQIVLISRLDRETKASYTLDVVVHDRVPSPRNASAIVQITVTDINDWAPAFDQRVYSTSVSESLSPGTKLLRVLAYDKDGDENAAILYSITSGNAENIFSVDAATGWITLQKSLDSESKDKHHLVVEAEDCSQCLSQNQLTCYTSVYINVTGVNDRVPQFPVPSLIRTVPENEPAGTTVFKAMAVDQDGDASLTYTLTDDQSHFSVNSATGVVRTLETFDYESRRSYNFKLSVVDQWGQSAVTGVEVRILDVDEFFPKFAQSDYNFNVRGDAKAGDVVGRLVATDADGGESGRVYFRFRQPTDYFAIDPRQGIIVVTKPLNGDTSRRKRSVDSSSLHRGKRALSDDTASLVVEATSGLPDSKTAVVVVECHVNRTCSGCAVMLPVSAALAGTPLILVIVFSIIFVVIIVVVALLIVRNRKSESRQPSPPSPYNNIFHVHGLEYDTSSRLDDPLPYKHHLHAYTNPAINLSSSEISDHSHSSGRGSAGDDDIDEELQIINSSPFSQTNQRLAMPDSGIQQDDDTVSDLGSVTNHQQYLARLGVDVDRLNINNDKNRVRVGASQSAYDSSMEPIDEVDVSDIVYDKLKEIEQAEDLHQIGAKPRAPPAAISEPQLHGSLSSVVNSEEEFSGSYNWDYLLDWGPQYQPLADVFNEIARLKDENIQPRRLPTQIVPQLPRMPGTAPSALAQKSNFPPPIITDTPPSCVQTPSNRASQCGVDAGSVVPSFPLSKRSPRSPIVHDTSFTSGNVYMPSFTPSLTPLGAVAPLYHPHQSRTNRKPSSLTPIMAPSLHDISGHSTPTSHASSRAGSHTSSRAGSHTSSRAGSHTSGRAGSHTSSRAGSHASGRADNNSGGDRRRKLLPMSQPPVHLMSGSDQEFRI